MMPLFQVNLIKFLYQSQSEISTMQVLEITRIKLIKNGDIFFSLSRAFNSQAKCKCGVNIQEPAAKILAINFNIFQPDTR